MLHVFYGIFVVHVFCQISSHSLQFEMHSHVYPHFFNPSYGWVHVFDSFCGHCYTIFSSYSPYFVHMHLLNSVTTIYNNPILFQIFFFQLKLGLDVYFFLFFQRLLFGGNFSRCKNFQGDYVVDP